MRWFFAALLVVGALAIGATTPASAADEHEVLITGTAFDPNPVNLVAGDEVYWCNDDDANHRIVFDGGQSSALLEPEDCTANLAFDSPGTFTYHDGENPQVTGSVVVAPAPTTTTTAAPATTVASTPATTVRPTATTRRTTTTRRSFSQTAATRASSTTSSTVPETTTTFFETTTSEFTTTTFGAFAINETGDGGGNNTAMLAILGVAVLGGAGYLGYHYRYRFLR